MLDGDPPPVVAKRLDASRCHLVLSREVEIDPGDIVLDGDLAPIAKGHIPQFSAHVYCG